MCCQFACFPICAVSAVCFYVCFHMSAHLWVNLCVIIIILIIINITAISLRSFCFFTLFGVSCRNNALILVNDVGI